MTVETSFAGSSVRTVGTRVRSLPGVYPNVPLQYVVVGGAVGAVWTSEGHVYIVGGNVLLQEVLAGGGIRTLGTREGLFPRVSQYVSL